jgi:cellulose synthase/poly-beta-1,6-N-acetylglucosamine synthase-like glycosyltransferase
MLQLSYIIVILYSISILLLFFYSLAHFNLLLNYLKVKNKDQSPQYDLSKANEIPYVTIQLPIYKKYVVERLLTTIAEMDYPKHLLEIQVLDDHLMIVVGKP